MGRHKSKYQTTFYSKRIRLHQELTIIEEMGKLEKKLNAIDARNEKKNIYPDPIDVNSAGYQLKVIEAKKAAKQEAKVKAKK